MNLIAIDPSLRSVGVYAVNGEREYSLTVTFHGQNLDNYIKLMVKSLSSVVEDFKPKVAVIEGPSYASKGNAVVTMGKVHGILRTILVEHSVRVFEIAPPTWKSIIFGSKFRKIKKTTADDRVRYIKLASRKFKRKFDSTDSADAYMLAKSL